MRPVVLRSDPPSIKGICILTLILAPAIALTTAPAVFAADSWWVINLFFFAIGLLMLAVLIQGWPMALLGISAQLTLPQSPIPLGVMQPAQISFARALPQRLLSHVHADLRIEQTKPNDESGYDTLWRQRIKVTMTCAKQGQLQLSLPSDMPANHSRSHGSQARLTLSAGQRSWAFDLSTRPARPDEIVLSKLSSKELGNLVETSTPEQIRRNRQRLLIVSALVVAAITAAQVAWNIFKP